MAQEGGGVGKELDFVVTTGRYTLSGEVGDAVASMIEQTGLKVKVIKMPHAQFLTRFRELDNPPALTFNSNGYELGEASQPLRNKYMCGGPIATYCSQEFDDLAKQVMGEPNRDKRIALTQKLTDLLERDLPYIPTVIPAQVYGKNPKLQFTPLPNTLLPVIDMKLSK